MNLKESSCEMREGIDDPARWLKGTSEREECCRSVPPHCRALEVRHRISHLPSATRQSLHLSLDLLGETHGFASPPHGEFAFFVCTYVKRSVPVSPERTSGLSIRHCLAMFVNTLNIRQT